MTLLIAYLVRSGDGTAVPTWHRLAGRAWASVPRTWGLYDEDGWTAGYTWPVHGTRAPGQPGRDRHRPGLHRYVVGPFSEIAGHLYVPDLGADGPPRAFAHLPPRWPWRSPKGSCWACDRLEIRTDVAPSCGSLPEMVVGEKSRYHAILSLRCGSTSRATRTMSSGGTSATTSRPGSIRP